MLIQHSLLYFVSRALPGAINLIALAVYTHILSPDEYGRYALVVYGVGLVNTLLYWWLRLGLIRFAPRFEANGNIFLATLLRGFIVASSVSLISSIVALIVVRDPQLRLLIAFSTLLLWVSAWFDINLELIRSRLSPIYFGVLSLSRALVALAVGGTLAWMGWSVWGVLIGAFIGVLLPATWETVKSWRGVNLKLIDGAFLRELFAYGLPLIGVFGLEYVISTSDRFMLGWLMDTAATGVYSAAYDLTNQSLILAMSVVYLAGYPLVVKTLEKEGAAAARRLLSRYLGVFLAIAIPAVFIVSFLAQGISGTLLGSRFQMSAVGIMPWVAVASLFAGLKSYYFDIAFQLSRRTTRQLLVVAVPAVLNVLLNVWWIPIWGVRGAAYATLAAYFCSSAMSWWLGRDEFPLPLLSRDVASILVAAGVMAIVAIAWLDGYDQSGVARWGFEAVVLMLIYTTTAFIMNVCGMRDWMLTKARGMPGKDAGL